MKRFLKLTIVLLVAAFALAGCGGNEESAEPAASDIELNKFGYVGTDEAEFAAYKYLAEDVAGQYEPGDASIPVATFIDKDESDPNDVLVKGDFWVYNYKIDGDTLQCVSGGAHPGCMHMKKNDDGTYTVTSFDVVADGSSYDASAKEIFGDKYEEFASVSSDAEAREAKRLEAVTAYVNANELPCTRYQDEGWDPVDLHL